MKIYLISVSSSTTRSHLVFGTEPLRNLWRIANVFPQWPANRDMLSINWPVRLNHILTMCCILVYKDKWPCYRKKNTLGISRYLHAHTRLHSQKRTHRATALPQREKSIVRNDANAKRFERQQATVTVSNYKNRNIIFRRNHYCKASVLRQLLRCNTMSESIFQHYGSCGNPAWVMLISCSNW